MNGRPPHLSPLRLLAGLVLPLAAYLIIRALIGSSVAALAIADAVPSTWLIVVGIARRRIDPIAILSATTVMLALAAYALTGGDPLAIKLRRGAVTGSIGIAGLASVALGRPLLLLVAENVARLNPNRSDIAARLAQPERRRAATILTAIIAAIFGIDGASQLALALTVPTASFVADSTAARIAFLGTGAVVTIQYLRHQKKRLDRAPRPPAHAGRD
ncbi:MAG: VC0807 family protein [Solirubrobacteraceae bacterium]